MPRRVGTTCPRCRRRRAKGERCPTCTARQGKSTTEQRGYGTRHQQMRAVVAVDVAEGRAVCWRCSKPIAPGSKWDLGHDDDDRTLYRGPEHANKCNRQAAGKRAATT